MFIFNACRALQDSFRKGHLHRGMLLDIPFTEVVVFRPDRRVHLLLCIPKAFESLIGHQKCNTVLLITLCPRYTGVEPDIWLGLVSLGSEVSSHPRCGIYCKGLANQSHFYHLQYLFTQQYINIKIKIQYKNTSNIVTST